MHNRVLWRLFEIQCQYSAYSYSCQINHGKFWITTKSLIVNWLFLQPMSDESDNGFEDDFDDNVEDEETEDDEY